MAWLSVRRGQGHVAQFAMVIAKSHTAVSGRGDGAGYFVGADWLDIFDGENFVGLLTAGCAEVDIIAFGFTDHGPGKR